MALPERPATRPRTPPKRSRSRPPWPPRTLRDPPPCPPARLPTHRTSLGLHRRDDTDRHLWDDTISTIRTADKRPRRPHHVVCSDLSKPHPPIPAAGGRQAGGRTHTER